VPAADVTAVFCRLLAHPAAVALAGSVPARARERAQALFCPQATTGVPGQ
jgi:hypothetical protein